MVPVDWLYTVFALLAATTLSLVIKRVSSQLYNRLGFVKRLAFARKDWTYKQQCWGSYFETAATSACLGLARVETLDLSAMAQAKALPIVLASGKPRSAMYKRY